MENNTISYINLEVLKESNFEESIDAIVPDLYLDIKEVLSVSAFATITDISIQSDRVLISGEICHDVCFLSDENDNILKMQVKLNFARSEDILAKDAILYPCVSVNSVQCKIINPRKISILSNLHLKTCVYRQDILQTNSHLGSPYEILTDTKEIKLIENAHQSDFILSDSISFNVSGNGDVYGITPEIQVVDLKVLKSKVMIRGNLMLKGFYIEQDQISNISSGISFSQIIDVSLDDETLPNSISLNVSNLELEHTLEEEYFITANIKCLFTQYKTHTIEVVEDIYSTTHEIAFEKSPKTVLVSNPKPYHNFDVSIPIEAENICEAIIVADANLYIENENNENVDIFASVRLIYKSNGSMYGHSKNYKVLENVPKPQINDVTIDISRPSEIKITATLCKEELENFSYTLFESIEQTEEKNFEKDQIILKYIGKEMNFWDIAKKYNSTQDAIKQANSIDLLEQSISSKMLIIPR